jgi:hypothetical protein
MGYYRTTGGKECESRLLVADGGWKGLREKYAEIRGRKALGRKGVSVRAGGGRMSKSDSLRIVCAEGEGQKIEFKAKTTNLAKEMVAFANASGGSLFLGISDDGKIVGVDDSNRLRSQIQDVANDGSGRSTNYALSNVSKSSGDKKEDR